MVCWPKTIPVCNLNEINDKKVSFLHFLQLLYMVIGLLGVAGRIAITLASAGRENVAEYAQNQLMEVILAQGMRGMLSIVTWTLVLHLMVKVSSFEDSYHFGCETTHIATL